MLLSVVFILGTLGWWLNDCKRYGEVVYYTKTAKLTTLKEVDPLFGTTVEKTTSEPGHWLGLLDVEPPYGALPMCGFWLALGTVGFVLHRRSAKTV